MTYGGWVIDKIAAETVYGSGWQKTWDRIIKAELIPLSNYSGDGLMRTQSVAEVTHIPRSKPDIKKNTGMTSNLASSVIKQLTLNPRDLLFLATNHGDTESIVPWAMHKLDRNPSVQAVESDFGKVSFGRLLDKAGGGCVVQSACASGLIALIIGALQARREDKDFAIIAADALSDTECIGFSVAKAISTKRCRPFHQESEGLTIGEGAAGLKCSWQTANELQRDTIAIMGFGMSCDAYHTTSPEPDGIAIEKAWRSAMEMAGIKPADIGAIVLHGTGTKSSDSVEAKVYRRIWGNSEGPAVCSIKGFVGHTMGVAGLLNILVAYKALQTGLLPPTLTEGKKEDTILPVGIGRPIKFDRKMKCLAVASGFGGQNAAVILSRGLL